MNSLTGRGFSEICIPPVSATSSRVIVSSETGRCGLAGGWLLPSQPSVWEHSCERYRAKSKHPAVEAPGASGNEALACRASCRACETLRRGVGGVRSHNGAVKHREALGVASAGMGRAVRGTPKPRPSGRGSFTKDQTISLEGERFLAKRMAAKTIERPSSRLSMISHPNEIADLILTARGSRRVSALGRASRRVTSLLRSPL
jgi:hypothetical protein